MEYIKICPKAFYGLHVQTIKYLESWESFFINTMENTVKVGDLMHELKARSHCTGRCKKDTRPKKILPLLEKRYTSFVYSLRTYFIRSTHQAPVHCDFNRLKSFELHKTFSTDEFIAVYDVNMQHIRATNGLCPLSFVIRLRYPFCFLLAS